MNDAYAKLKVMELAEEVYPVDEDTKVVLLSRSGVSVTIPGGVKALKLQDKLESFWVEYVHETNVIYALQGGERKWKTEPDSGYQKLER